MQLSAGQRRLSAWEKLPSELLEKVMAVLPLRDVCRARTVCKKWNQVLSTPEAAATRGLTPRQASNSILIAPKRSLYKYPKMEWEVQDVAEKEVLDEAEKEVLDEAEKEVLDEAENDIEKQPLGHSYILRHGFYLEFFGRIVKPKNLASLSELPYLARNPEFLRYTLAADGELVYTILEKPRTDSRVHVVCNPVCKMMHEIPELQYSFDHDIVVMMSMQSAASAYKIIVMDSYARVRPRSELVHLYDSTTAAWTTLSTLPSRDYYACSSIFMNGVLYTLFVDTTKVPWYRMLFTCDLATGAWTSIDVDLPRLCHPQDKAQLVVSSGRLFLVEYTGLPLRPLFGRSSWELQIAARRTSKKHLVQVFIWEIQLATQEAVEVTYFKDFAKYSRTMLKFKEELVVAVGCSDSIVIISCLLKKRVAYDLSKNDWVELEQPHRLPFPHGALSRGVFASRGIFVGNVDF